MCEKNYHRRGTSEVVLQSQHRLLPWGPAGGVFAVNVYNGAVQAQADLGLKVVLCLV